MKTHLIINRSESLCGSCRGGADPYEKAHNKRLGYDSADRSGCGAEFTEVGSHYRGDIEKTVRWMRPDLPWTEKM